jgi:hypothetical protein
MFDGPTRHQLALPPTAEPVPAKDSPSIAVEASKMNRMMNIIAPVSESIAYRHLSSTGSNMVGLSVNCAVVNVGFPGVLFHRFN